MIRGGEQRPSGWDSHQQVHSLVCLLDLLLGCSFRGKLSAHNDPEKDVKLPKALNPHWISHPINFGYKPNQFLLLLSGRPPCPAPYSPSFFVSLLKQTGEVYSEELKEEKGSCAFHFRFI